MGCLCLIAAVSDVTVDLPSPADLDDALGPVVDGLVTFFADFWVTAAVERREDEDLVGAASLDGIPSP